jgi:NAD(P)-dependent dehydrogenase (short-subunit alcohol dehydrogenase family)
LSVVITGASNGGLGGATAVALAKAKPAHLLLLARSQSKVDPVIAAIREIDSEVKVNFVSLSLDDSDSVRAAADAVNSKISKLDILINNAGVMAIDGFTTNKAGIEMQFATNHIGHFLLTKLLWPKIEAAGPGSRIVNLASVGHKIGPCRFEDYNFNNGKDYEKWSAYGQSKSSNILFSLGLARRLKSKSMQSYGVHPGGRLSSQILCS